MVSGDGSWIGNYSTETWFSETAGVKKTTHACEKMSMLSACWFLRFVFDKLLIENACNVFTWHALGHW